MLYMDERTDGRMDGWTTDRQTYRYIIYNYLTLKYDENEGIAAAYNMRECN